VVFDAGEFEPRSLSGQALLNHEMMHVVQQRSAVADGNLSVDDLQSPLERHEDMIVPRWMVQRQPKKDGKADTREVLPTSLNGYPEAERQAITVLDSLDAGFSDVVAEAFDPDRAAHYDTDADTRIVYSSTIEAKYKTTLDSLVNQMVGFPGHNLATVNQTVTTLIAPMKQMVRFTYFQHGKIKVILVEGMGAAPANAGGKAGEDIFNAKHCKFVTTWGDDKKQFVYKVLAQMPASTVSEGLIFARAVAPKETKATGDKAKDEEAKKKDALRRQNEAAVYDPDANTLTLFDAAFTSATPEDVRDTLVHEMGHGADFAPTKQANPAKQLSGGDADPDDYGADFRKAGKKDGIAPDTPNPPKLNKIGEKLTLKGAETAYGNTNWKELFAESFRIYVTDPNLLEALRPNIYHYFLDHFPRPASAAETAGKH
jgi:hypothetical protein